MLINSSKDAPAQKARTPAERRTMTRVWGSLPAPWTSCVRASRSWPGSELLWGWKNSIVVTPSWCSVFTYPSLISRSISWYYGLVLVSGLVLLFDHRENGGDCHRLTRFIIDIHKPFYDAPGEVRLGLFFLGDLLFTREPDADGAAGVHRFQKTAFFEAIVQHHGTFAGVDEEAGRRTEHKIAVGDGLFEKRAAQRRMIGVRIKMVPAQVREITDVRLGDGAFVRDHRVPYLQLFEVFPEGMAVVRDLARMGLPVARDGSDHRGRTLYGHPLHIVKHAPGAAHLLAATRAPGAAVDQERERATVAGAFFRAFVVEDQDAPMPGRRTEHIPAREAGVRRDDRTAEGSPALLRKFDRLLVAIIGHQRADRPERFDRVRFFAGKRLFVEQQDRGKECALPGVGVDDLHAVQRTIDQPGRRQQPAHLSPYLLALRLSRQRPHPHLLIFRVPDGGLRKGFRDRLQGLLHLVRRHENAADGGAFLTGLHGHFLPQLPDEEVPLGHAGLHVLAEHQAIQGIRFHIEGDIFTQDVGMGAELQTGGGRAGKGHHVLRAHMIQQVPGTPADQLQGAGRQNTGPVDLPDNGFRQERGDGGGFDDGGDTREQVYRYFLKHPPDREVEGIDMDRDPLLRHQDMMGHEA